MPQLVFLEAAQLTPNKSLRVTFDPVLTFATAKAGVASNAPELRRYRLTRMSALRPTRAKQKRTLLSAFIDPTQHWKAELYVAPTRVSERSRVRLTGAVIGNQRSFCSAELKMGGAVAGQTGRHKDENTVFCIVVSGLRC